MERLTDDTRQSSLHYAHSSESAISGLTSFSFATVQVLISAARVLKEHGFDVIVAPRRIAGCGVVLVLDAGQVSAALTFLNRLGIEPDSVGAYCPNGGGS